MVVTVSDGFDLAGPAAEVVLAVKAWAAKMERLAINERIASARFRLEQEGRSWGRPPRLSPLERARITELPRRGATIRETAIAVHAPRATVARALSHEVTPPAAPGRDARARSVLASGGKSSRTVCQRTFTSTPKYSWATLLRMLRMSAQGISGASAGPVSLRALAASPMTTMA